MTKGGGDTAASEQLAATMKQLTEQTDPFRKEYLAQQTELLTDPESWIKGQGSPFIQSAMARLGQGVSQNAQRTREGLDTAGLSRTPFGQRIMAEQSAQAGQAQSQIPVGIAQAFMQGGPAFASSLTGQGIQAGSAAAGVEGQLAGQQAGMMGQIGQAAAMTAMILAMST